MSDQITPLVQRQPEEEEEEALLQTKSAPGYTPTGTAGVVSTIAPFRGGGGQPLPASGRSFFEPRFGADFSHVRIHTGAEPAESARKVNAKAFTLGHDIVFAKGQFAPETDEGRRLIAHELTHVVQQSGTESGVLQRRDVRDANLEQDATVEVEELLRSNDADATDQQLLAEIKDYRPVADLLAIDPFRVHLSDRDIQRIVDAKKFGDFIVAHDLVWGWLEDAGELWYVSGEDNQDFTAKGRRQSRRAERRGVELVPPRHASHFYDALLTHPKTEIRVASAGSIDFGHVPPDTLTETELWSLSDTGRFFKYADYYGMMNNFLHAQTGDFVEPSNIEEFNDMRARALDATPTEVVERFKSILLGYLAPTVAFYDQHLLRAVSIGSRGIPIAQGVLDLFTLYLQTRSVESLAKALAVYFGVHDNEASAAADRVAAAFFGFLENARAIGFRSRAAEDSPSTIETVLDTLPEDGQSVSTTRPFDELSGAWGAVVSLLLNDLDLTPLFLFGIQIPLPPCSACHGEELMNRGALDLGLVERIEKRRDDAAELALRVKSIASPDDVYGIIHLFKNSEKDRAYLYKRVIGIPESLVNEAANAPRLAVRQACPSCHEATSPGVPERPADVDATESEWMLAVTLANARHEQAVWDMAVDILIVGGSIGAALVAGALSGGIGWAAVPAAMAAAGGAAAVTSLYEHHEARLIEHAASGAHAASDRFPEFGLGSEQHLIWAEKNLAYTQSAGIGNVLVAIATAPIGGVQGPVIKRILGAMTMGGLDGFCSWLVDKRINDADFLVETHALKGGTPETATTTGQTLVMSIGAGALFGGAFEGGVQGIQGTGRLFFHVEVGSGRTRVTTDDGSDVTMQVEMFDEQLRRGETRSNSESSVRSQTEHSGMKIGNQDDPSIDMISPVTIDFGYVSHDFGIVLKGDRKEIWMCSNHCDSIIKKIKEVARNVQDDSLQIRLIDWENKFMELQARINTEVIKEADVRVEIKKLALKLREDLRTNHPDVGALEPLMGSKTGSEEVTNWEGGALTSDEIVIDEMLKKFKGDPTLAPNVEMIRFGNEYLEAIGEYTQRLSRIKELDRKGLLEEWEAAMSGLEEFERYRLKPFEEAIEKEEGLKKRYGSLIESRKSRMEEDFVSSHLGQLAGDIDVSRVMVTNQSLKNILEQIVSNFEGRLDKITVELTPRNSDTGRASWKFIFPDKSTLRIDMPGRDPRLKRKGFWSDRHTHAAKESPEGYPVSDTGRYVPPATEVAHVPVTSAHVPAGPEPAQMPFSEFRNKYSTHWR